MSVVAIPQTAARAAPRNLGDRILRGALRLVALTLVLLVVAIVVEMLRTALPAFRAFGWRFLVTSTWDPVAERFGVVPFVYGTVVSSLLALLIAVPLGIGTAIYLAEVRYGRSGLVGAILLGLGRALGETMAVTMVIGNRPEVALSLFAPGYTMASVIANEFTEATSDLYLSALIEIGLLLFVVTVIVNALARLLVWSVGGPIKAVRE